MSTTTDRAAEIIESNVWVDGDHLAQALADADLLATPERDDEQEYVRARLAIELMEQRGTIADLQERLRDRDRLAEAVDLARSAIRAMRDLADFGRDGDPARQHIATGIRHATDTIEQAINEGMELADDDD